MKEEVGEVWFIKGVKKVRFALYHRISNHLERK